MNIAWKVLELVRKEISPPSFLKEPKNFALSLDKIQKLCFQNGLNLTESELYTILDQDLSDYLWTEICAAKLYVTGIKCCNQPYFVQ
ncbi:MAG: hypothetical protein HUU50_07580 [Candidatus Brocadiae bacterium]|nr:hypothetical protein [Candidatus Brocadiia bacterium]